MSDAVSRVRPKTRSKQDVSVALGIGWQRAQAKLGKGRFADAIGGTTKLIDRALIGESVPELHTALNSLLADGTALNEVFALYDLHPPRRRNAQAVNDLDTASKLSALVAMFCAALSDGKRDHRETLALADEIRPLMPALTALLTEANHLRGINDAA